MSALDARRRRPDEEALTHLHRMTDSLRRMVAASRVGSPEEEAHGSAHAVELHACNIAHAADELLALTHELRATAARNALGDAGSCARLLPWDNGRSPATNGPPVHTLATANARPGRLTRDSYLILAAGAAAPVWARGTTPTPGRTPYCQSRSASGGAPRSWGPARE